MVDNNCFRCKKLAEGIKEAVRAIKHSQRTLDIIVNNQHNPRIIVQCAIDTETYLRVSLNELKEIARLCEI